MDLGFNARSQRASFIAAAEVQQTHQVTVNGLVKLSLEDKMYNALRIENSMYDERPQWDGKPFHQTLLSVICPQL